MKSKIGKDILLSEIQKRTKELEDMNSIQESKYKEMTNLVNSLNVIIEEKKASILELDTLRKAEEERIKGELDIALEEYKVQIEKLSKPDPREKYAIVQFEDGSFNLTDIKNLKPTTDVNKSLMSPITTSDGSPKSDYVKYNNKIVKLVKMLDC